MSTRPKMRREKEADHPSRGPKDFEELAERVFRDDSPGEPLYGGVLDNEEAGAA